MLKLGTLIEFGMEITQIKFKLVNLKIWYCEEPWRHRKFQNAPIVLNLGTLIEFGMEITQIKFKLVNLKNLVLRGTVTSSKISKCSNWAKIWYTDWIKNVDYDSKIWITNYKNLELRRTVMSSKISNCSNQARNYHVD